MLREKKDERKWKWSSKLLEHLKVFEKFIHKHS